MTGQERIRGVMTAMVTPFTQDGAEIDQAGFENNLEMQLNAGVIPVILGTTGEAPQVKHHERRLLVDMAVSHSKGHNRPVVIGVTSENYLEMMRMAEEAAEHGAGYILATPAPYVKQQQQDILAMFRELNEIGVPVIVYNIQSRIGVNIETPTLSEIAALSNVAAVKEASGNLSQIKEVIENVRASRPGFSVLSGDDNITYRLMELGGDGVISVVSNLFPQAVAGMVSSHLNGDRPGAEMADRGLQELYKAAFREGNPKSIKGLMREKGLPAGPTRKPLYGLKPETVAYFKEVLVQYQNFK